MKPIVILAGGIGGLFLLVIVALFVLGATAQPEQEEVRYALPDTFQD